MWYLLQRIEVLTVGIKRFINCIYPVESDADSADSLRLENEKLQTQVESLKAIAEQNTSLMWSMQSYQYQAEEIRQQYNNMIAAKDYEVGTNSLYENTYSLKGRNLLEGFRFDDGDDI